MNILGLWSDVIVSIVLLMAPGFYISILFFREKLGWLVRTLVSFLISIACWIIGSFYLSAIGLKLTRQNLLLMSLVLLGLALIGYSIRFGFFDISVLNRVKFIKILDKPTLKLILLGVIGVLPILYLYSSYTPGALILFPSASELRALQNGNSPRDWQILANTNLLAADIYLDLGQYDEAMEAFARILAIEPNKAEELREEYLLPFIHNNQQFELGFFLVAETYFKQQRLEEATSYYQEVIARSPQSYSGHLAQARIAQIQGNSKRALEECREAIVMSPNSVAANLMLAQLYRLNGLYWDAINTLHKVEELWSENAIVSEMIHRTQGDLYQAGGKVNTAVASYYAAAELRSRSRVSTSNLSSSNPGFKFYDFLENIDDSQRSEPETDYISKGIFFIDNMPTSVLLQHSPSSITYEINIPKNSQLQFQIALSPEVWRQDQGDGVQFIVGIKTNNKVYRLFSKYIDPKNSFEDRRWFYESIDLSYFSGQDAQITFMTVPGPNGDTRFDWAGWGEPRIVQPAYFSFLETLSEATYTADAQHIRRDWMVIDDDLRDILFQHPSTEITYQNVEILENSTLYFGIGLDPQVWSEDKVDGVEFEILVRDETKQLLQVFDQTIDPKNNPNDRHWLDAQVDLSQFAGQTVDFYFLTHPGPAGNSDYDWAAWSNPVIVSLSE